MAHRANAKRNKNTQKKSDICTIAMGSWNYNGDLGMWRHVLSVPQPEPIKFLRKFAITICVCKQISLAGL